MPRRVLIGCCAALLLLSEASARADLVLSVGSPTIPQGGTGTLDIWARSTAALSSPDQINNYAFTIQITGPNELRFSSVQGFNYLASNEYIFAGDSAAQTTSSTAGTVTTTVYADDTFVGNDSTPGNPISLSSASAPVLLAAVTLDGTITNPGETYTISLKPSSGDGSMNSNSQTLFDVVDFAKTGLETSAVAFTSTSGHATVASSAVPEPSSLRISLTVILMVVGASRAWRR